MLENLSRDPPDHSTSDTDSPLIPDPWETPSSGQNANAIYYSSPFSTEPRPLITSAGTPNGLNLPTPRVVSNISSIQVLLQDGLKLRAYDGGKLTVQIRKALALLGWMGTITHTIA